MWCGCMSELSVNGELESLENGDPVCPVLKFCNQHMQIIYRSFMSPRGRRGPKILAWPPGML